MSPERSGTPADGRERARHLMMAALDGEISRQEQEELEGLLSGDADLSEEWERLRRIKEATGMIGLAKPPEEVWGRYWESVYNKVERGIAWILGSVGAILLLSWGAWKGVMALAADPDIPSVVKFGLLSLVIGAVVLFVSVAREKLFTRARDPYREVER